MEINTNKVVKGKVLLLSSLVLFILIEILVALLIPDLMKGFVSRMVVIGILFAFTYYGYLWARIAISICLILYAISILLIGSVSKDFLLFLYSIQLLLMSAFLHTSGYLKEFFLMRKLKREKQL